MNNTGTYQDQELIAIIEGCKEGNRIYQEKLYKYMYPKMMSMVKRYTNPHQYHIAEEILNNGFLKVFQKVNSYKYEGAFEGWVRRVIYHCIFDYVRQNMKYSKNVLFIEKDELVSADLLGKLKYDELMKLIQQLPITTRSVFNMYVMECLTHKEISNELNISEGTSKWHLFEARKILKQKVEQLNK